MPEAYYIWSSPYPVHPSTIYYSAGDTNGSTSLWAGDSGLFRQTIPARVSTKLYPDSAAKEATYYSSGQQVAISPGGGYRFFIDRDNRLRRGNSSDLWITLSPVGIAAGKWTALRIAQDSGYIFIGEENGSIQVSRNNGDTWSDITPIGVVQPKWISIAPSVNGQFLLAADWGGRLWRSVNAGTSWDETRPAGNADYEWGWVASDASGSTLMAKTESSAYLYKNGTWRNVSVGNDWINKVDMDKYGNVLAQFGPNHIHYSVNSGVTWSSYFSDEEIVTGFVSWNDGQIYTPINYINPFSGLIYPSPHPDYVVWSDIVTNSNASILLAVDSDNRMWYQRGDHFTEARPHHSFYGGGSSVPWSSVALDDDGSFAIAAYSSESTSGLLYTSTNLASDVWTSHQFPLGLRRWNCVAADGDGSNWIACSGTGAGGGGGLFTYNGTWSERTPSGTSIDTHWKAVASDEDGSCLYAVAYAGRVYRSTNSGVSWTEVYPPGVPVNMYWTTIGCDATGQHVIAACEQGGVYISSDYGDNWTEHFPTQIDDDYDWDRVFMSRDANSITAHISTSASSEGLPGTLYSSFSGGSHWTQVVPPSGNASINSSSVYNGGNAILIASAGTILKGGPAYSISGDANFSLADSSDLDIRAGAFIRGNAEMRLSGAMTPRLGGKTAYSGHSFFTLEGEVTPRIGGQDEYEGSGDFTLEGDIRYTLKLPDFAAGNAEFEAEASGGMLMIGGQTEYGSDAQATLAGDGRAYMLPGVLLQGDASFQLSAETPAEIRRGANISGNAVMTILSNSEISHGFNIGGDANFQLSADGREDSLPHIRVTAPRDGSSVIGDSVTVSVLAQSSSGISSLVITVDGDSHTYVYGHVPTSIQQTLIWNTTMATIGQVVISATATDSNSKINTDSIRVLVKKRMVTAPGAISVDYGERFVITDDPSVAATVNIRMQKPTGTSPTHVELSNTEGFPEGHYLRLPYVENREYDVTALTDYDPNSASIVINPIVATDPDYPFNLVRIQGWKMDTGEGEKRVYVRYIVP